MKEYFIFERSERYLLIPEMPPPMIQIVEEYIAYGQSVSDTWKPFQVKFEEKKKRISDFPYMDNHIPVISERALDCLRDHILPYVEILPLDVVGSENKYFGLNVRKIYPIDIRRSKCSGWYVEQKGKEYFCLTSIDIHAFPDDILPDAPIFRISEVSSLSSIYVSDEFKRVVEENKLTGLLFDVKLCYRTGPERGPFKTFYGKTVNIDTVDLTDYEKGKLLVFSSNDEEPQILYT